MRRGRSALVYTARDGNLSPDQFERLKSELEAGFQGAAHAGRPLLLEGGLDWKSMSLSPKDMDFIEAKHVAAREISLALGVPPMLLGIPGDNTYSNYQEANRSFWRLTVLPLVARTAKALSAWLAPAYDAPLELRPDLDGIDALSPERDALWSRLEKTTFLTSDEKRTAIGYAPLGDTPFAAGLKYRPDQSRDDHGRWTDEGGREADAAIVPAADRPDKLPIDLIEERARGGHTIEGHVNKSSEQLASRVRAEALATVERGDEFRGLAIGSFFSLQSAIKLVNSTVADGQEEISALLRGEIAYAKIDKRFNSQTGYEMYFDRLNSRPYERDTYGVRALIVRDESSPRGYRVQSAFPIR